MLAAHPDLYVGDPDALPIPHPVPALSIVAQNHGFLSDGGQKEAGAIGTVTIPAPQKRKRTPRGVGGVLGTPLRHHQHLAAAASVLRASGRRHYEQWRPGDGEPRFS